MKKMMKAVVATALLGSASVAVADVWVNGQRMNATQLMQLTKMAGEPIPDGRYWLNNAGYWGYEGDATVQGNLYTGAYYGSGSSSNSGTWVDTSPGYGNTDGAITKYKPGCYLGSVGSISIDTCDM